MSFQSQRASWTRKSPESEVTRECFQRKDKAQGLKDLILFSHRHRSAENRVELTTEMQLRLPRQTLLLKMKTNIYQEFEWDAQIGRRS